MKLPPAIRLVTNDAPYPNTKWIVEERVSYRTWPFWWVWETEWTAVPIRLVGGRWQHWTPYEAEARRVYRRRCAELAGVLGIVSDPSWRTVERAATGREIALAALSSLDSPRGRGPEFEQVR